MTLPFGLNITTGRFEGFHHGHLPKLLFIGGKLHPSQFQIEAFVGRRKTRTFRFR
jgi:hypothetical protein